MNKVILMGRFTREPELSYTPSGTAKVTGSLATSEKYKTRDGDYKESTEYHRIIVWGRLAEVVAQYFGKGDGIFVEGRLTHRSWEKDGQTQYITEVVVNSFEFPPGKSQVRNASPDLPDSDDDIPF